LYVKKKKKKKTIKKKNLKKKKKVKVFTTYFIGCAGMPNESDVCFLNKEWKLHNLQRVTDSTKYSPNSGSVPDLN
jgi:ssDNA-binding Zn-finger/Zn-ribbon topoisomerase 1